MKAPLLLAACLAAFVSAATAQPLRSADHFITAGAAVLASACPMDLAGIVAKTLAAP